MLTLPNIISLIRVPLAMAFLQESLFLRALSVILALLSDGLDGFIARRYRQTTRIGTLLDPVTDRFFVILALAVLYSEGRLQGWQIAAMFCRDGSILLFGFYLFVKGTIADYYLRAIWCGKITTVVQLSILFCLILNITIPNAVFYTLIALGFLALAELGFSSPYLATKEGPRRLN